jgi:hypothetical protein
MPISWIFAQKSFADSSTLASSNAWQRLHHVTATMSAERYKEPGAGRNRQARIAKTTEITAVMSIGIT